MSNSEDFEVCICKDEPTIHEGIALEKLGLYVEQYRLVAATIRGLAMKQCIRNKLLSNMRTLYIFTIVRYTYFINVVYFTYQQQLLAAWILWSTPHNYTVMHNLV